MSASKAKPFTLKEPSIEEIAKRLAGIYAQVKLSRDPMFSWLEIMNDVTILGEDLRRDRGDEAVDRAATVLARLLEFIGYFTYIHEPGNDNTVHDIVARSLQQTSYSKYIPEDKLREGPTRWILAKYPFACSKCGNEQCHCLLAPWVLENRREEPDEYFDRFWTRADERRSQLRDCTLQEFTLHSLLNHFSEIYRANYYHQDAWKLGMHLSEEMGEATVELRRIELRRRAEKAGYDIVSQASDIIGITRARIENQTKKITKLEEQTKFRVKAEAQLKAFEAKLGNKPWEFFGNIVAEKFKEEIADVFSWLVAIIISLDSKDLKIFKKFPKRFEREGKGGVLFLACPWCHEAQCSDDCLIAHGVSQELTEQILKF